MIWTTITVTKSLVGRQEIGVLSGLSDQSSISIHPEAKCAKTWHEKQGLTREHRSEGRFATDTLGEAPR